MANRSKSVGFFLAVAFEALLSTPAHCELTWPTREVTITTKMGDEAVSAVYIFRNEGKSEVKILSVETSCGCTTVNLSKKIYAPGEHGEIKARFEIGERTGLQEKTITVVSDDRLKSTTFLTLRVDIPPLVTIEPRALFWTPGSKNISKEIIVKGGSDVEVKLLPTAFEAGTFKIEQFTDIPGVRYRLRVTPSSTNQETDAQIPLMIESTVGRPKEYKVLLFVR